MAKTTRKSARSRPSALVRAEHGGAPIKLDASQRTLLNKALRRGEDLREQMESVVTSYGRWLLDEVFDGETSAALDERTKNPVWLELVRRAGGPTLRISRRLLYVSLAIAANDKRITDQAWRGLDTSRKELLLPLKAGDTMREAAQHVSKWNLTQAKTREYVTEILESDGRPRQVRLTAKGIVSRVRRLRESLGSAAVLRKMSELNDGLSAADRRQTLDEIRRLSELLGEVTRALAKKT